MGTLKARVSGLWVPISLSSADLAAEQAARIAADNALSALIGSVLVAQTVQGTLQSVGTGGTNLTGLTVTFTATAGHRYVVVGQVGVRQRTVGGLPRMAILTTMPSPATIGGTRISLQAEEYATLMAMSKVNTPGAGSVTYNLQGYTSGGTCDYNGTAEFDSIIQVFRV
jgi:hypothetical protein